MTLITTTSLLLTLLLHHPSPTTGHGYLKSPRSRNYVAYVDGVWSGDTPTLPKKETCPHCLNLGGTLARCGVVQGRSYDAPPSATGGVLPFDPQASVTEGETMDFEVVLTAHHKGHFEYKACALAEGVDVASQECFDAHPMIFVKDLLYGAIKDDNYPSRAYIPLSDFGLDRDATGGITGYLFKHRYRFPAGLTGGRVLIQWHYVTANSCHPEGYDSYDWPEGFYPGDLPPCGPLPHDGNGVPEQFWNCAEVSITPAGPTTPTKPAPPTPSPTRPPIAPITPPTASPSLSPTEALSTPTNPTAPVRPPTAAPVSPSTTSPLSTPTSLPCGGGVVGNGICANPIHCCSKWGYCGTSTDHCGGSPPTAPISPPPPPTTTPPPPTPPTAPGTPVGDNRLIAYLGNWQSCPPLDQVQPYTHIVIGFAVTYTWSPNKNICSETCEIATPPICSNAPNPNLLSLWKSMGKKVLLSFGGAGMGGSWAGDNNDCWEYCYGKEALVVDRLLDIVEELGLDGVDIDYEYFYDDNQNGSGFAKGEEAKRFLNEVTLGLRKGLGPGKELAHAPMDPDLVPGKGYYDLIKTWGRDDVLDFIMPQYYNGLTRPVNDPDGAMAHYATLVDEAFKKDATKMVFGFCISDCSGTGSNANGVQAAKMMTIVRGSYACNGGAFFWVADHDGNGAWSKVVSREIAPYRGCSGVNTPTGVPTTVNGTLSPSEIVYDDDEDDDTNTTVSPSEFVYDDDEDEDDDANTTVSPSEFVYDDDEDDDTNTTAPPSEFEGDYDDDMYAKTASPSDVLPDDDDDDVLDTPTVSPIATPTTVNSTFSPSEIVYDDDEDDDTNTTVSPTEFVYTDDDDEDDDTNTTVSPSEFVYDDDEDDDTNTTVSPSVLPGDDDFSTDAPTTSPIATRSPTASPVAETDPPTKSPVATPPTNDSCVKSCSPGESGLKPYDGCAKFYHCVDGVVTGEPIPCAKGTLFDKDVQYCNWESQVDCPCNGDSTAALTTRQYIHDDCVPSCETKEAHLKAFDACRKYYKCNDGKAGEIMSIPDESLLFDESSQNFNWKEQVDCIVEACPAAAEEGEEPVMRLRG